MIAVADRLAARIGAHGSTGVHVCSGGYVDGLLCRAKRWLNMQDFEVDVAFRLGCEGQALAAVSYAVKVAAARFDTVRPSEQNDSARGFQGL